MLPCQHICIPRHAHKDRLHSTAQRRQEDLANLQADQKAESHDHGRVLPALVVGRVREFKVEEGEQAAEERDEGGAHGQDGRDEAVVDEGVDAAAFEECEGVLCGGDVGFAEEGDVDEGVAIDESVGFESVDDRNEVCRRKRKESKEKGMRGTYWTSQSMMLMTQPKRQKAMLPQRLPCDASCDCAILTACRIMLIKATISEPKLILPKE